MTQDEVEKRIAQMFEENYQMFLLEGGHALANYTKQRALEQVIAYYRRLRHIAENVSETEVKLSLPNETTPNGNKFNIEGRVDIVQEGSETWMYDLKTHDADFIRSHADNYRSQLNVYAHVWQNLRNNNLDHTAIISTALPEKVRTAIKFGGENSQELAFRDWNPVIEIDCSPENIEGTIADFAKIVDEIEDRHFSAPDVQELRKKVEGTKVQFASYICQNCDARYSCASYREYARQSGAKGNAELRRYLEDSGNAAGNDERVMANLEKGNAETTETEGE